VEKKKEKNRGHTIVFKKVAKSLTGYVMLLGKKKKQLDFWMSFWIWPSFWSSCFFIFFKKRKRGVKNKQKQQQKNKFVLLLSLSLLKKRGDTKRIF